MSDILEGMTLGSSEDDNVTIRTPDGDSVAVDGNKGITYEALKNAADAMAKETFGSTAIDIDFTESDTASPFGDDEEGGLELHSAFPVLYVEEEKDFKVVKSAVAFHYKPKASGFSFDVDDDEYVAIFDDAKRIPKEKVALTIAEKDIIRIGKGPKTKVDKATAGFFVKLSLSTKMKIGKATELEDDELDEKLIKSKVAETLAEREAGLVQLAAKLKGGMSSGKLADFLKVYAFKKHVLVTGPAGHGKTYIVDKFATEYGVTSIFKALDEGTESIDLLGHQIKLSDGSFKWKDGVLTSAFRKAQTEKVLLFVDEMLRAPVKELNILVGSLSPNSRKQYQLRTGRPMEEAMEEGSFLAEEEIISIPMENLFVVATTNQGSGYNTGRIDRALKDRFRLFYQEASREETEDIVYDKAMELLKVESTAKNLTSILMAIMDEIKEMKETGNLPEEMSLRHISEVLDTSSNARDVKSRMLDIAPNIVSITSDGKFNPTQLNIITDIIKAKL